MDLKKEQWGSRWGFMLATAGAAVGLGNIWKFPYIAGMNGGGAFVLVYFLCILFVGLPLIIAELTLGRASGCNPVGAFSRFTRDKRTPIAAYTSFGMILTGVLLYCFQSYGYGTLLTLIGLFLLIFGWKFIGVMIGVFVPAVILSYYGVIGGWTMLYILKAFGGELAFSTQAEADNVLMPILEAPREMWFPVIASTVLFIALAGTVVFFGVKKGIERSAKILMPVLFLLLLALVLRGITLPGAGKGIRFFLSPDFSTLRAQSVLIALGHAFFTLSLAMGITMTFGSYLDKKENIVRSSLIIISLDTMAAILAGIAVFSAVFAMGFDPAAGPGLVFEIVPAAFHRIPGNFGWLWNCLFFTMLMIAALTSSISLLEPVVSFGQEQLKLSRHASTLLAVLAISALSVLSALSCANWNNFPALEHFFKTVFNVSESGFFDMLDNFCSNWLLPLGGLAISLFVGWVWTSERALRELRKGTRGSFDSNLILLLAGIRDERGLGDNRRLFTPAIFWAISIRYLTPILVLLAFFHCIGLI